MKRLRGLPAPELNDADSMAWLVFAAKEAYYHINDRDPDVSEDDPLAGQSRCASFVCQALLIALECADSEVEPE